MERVALIGREAQPEGTEQITGDGDQWEQQVRPGIGVRTFP
jgi:hypothetical protein